MDDKLKKEQAEPTKTAEPKQETVTISKAELEQMQSQLASLSGLADLVTKQQETIKTLNEQVANASSRIDNTAAAMTGGYIRPAKVPGGKHEYLTIKGKVLYKQAGLNGVITESEKDFEITMPRPCGHLNGIESELRGRLIPRLFKSKGITDYAIVSVDYDESEIKTEKKEVSFIGKKPFEMSDEECQEFAIIYEAMSIPVVGSVDNMRKAVAQEWAYVLYDVKLNKPARINGRLIDKKQETLDLVQYRGVRQAYPELSAMTPSQFREVAESAESK